MEFVEYVIPASGARHLRVGKWVEIFRACGEEKGEKPIRVQSMRVEGRALVFRRGCSDLPEPRTIRPHEGEVVAIERRPEETRFKIRLDS